MIIGNVKKNENQDPVRVGIHTQNRRRHGDDVSCHASGQDTSSSSIENGFR